MIFLAKDKCYLPLSHAIHIKVIGDSCLNDAENKGKMQSPAVRCLYRYCGKCPSNSVSVDNAARWLVLRAADKLVFYFTSLLRPVAFRI